MNTPRKLVVAGALALVLLLVVWRLVASLAEEPARCEICARAIHPPTAFSVQRNGAEVWACCPRCGLTILPAVPPAQPVATATDFFTGKRFPAASGFYLEGSDLTPCCSPDVIVDEAKLPCGKCFDRCYPSVIAFARAEDALRFSQDHGGQVVPFDTLVREVKKP